MAATAGLNRRLICASDELAEGGRGVRFTVDRHGVSEPAFVVRFRGRVMGFALAAPQGCGGLVGSHRGSRPELELPSARREQGVDV